MKLGRKNLVENAGRLLSSVFSARASSEIRIWRALASMRFSPPTAAVLIAAPQVANDL